MKSINPIFIFATAFLAVYVESSFHFLRALIGAQIDLLPLLMVYAALTHRIEICAGLAICGGLWFDSLSANPIGISVLPLFLVGLVITNYRSLLLRDLPYAQFILGTLAGAFVPAFTLVALLTLDRHPRLGWGSLWQWFVLTFFGGILTPVCFSFFDKLNRAVSYQRVHENNFREDRQIKRGRF
jgi:rod shape-determining protein MreD